MSCLNHKQKFFVNMVLADFMASHGVRADVCAINLPISWLSQLNSCDVFKDILTSLTKFYKVGQTLKKKKNQVSRLCFYYD